MTCSCPVITLSPRDYDAVLFDLDGVAAFREFRLNIEPDTKK